MFTLTSSPLNGAFTARPVCKATDKPVIRELFRKEFYGNMLHSYPDEGLWEIYDSMEPNEDDLFGAYMVFYRDRFLFLLEIHHPMMMGLSPDLSGPGTIGIYTFYANPADPMNITAFRACISRLLDSVDRVLTLPIYTIPADPRVTILAKSGFLRLSKSHDPKAIFGCTAQSFPIFRGAGHASQIGA
jgi:hypothetical protein